MKFTKLKLRWILTSWNVKLKVQGPIFICLTLVVRASWGDKYLKNVPANVVVVGNPAKIIKSKK